MPCLQGPFGFIASSRLFSLLKRVSSPFKPRPSFAKLTKLPLCVPVTKQNPSTNRIPSGQVNPNNYAGQKNNLLFSLNKRPGERFPNSGKDKGFCWAAVCAGDITETTHISRCFSWFTALRSHEYNFPVFHRPLGSSRASLLTAAIFVPLYRDRFAHHWSYHLTARVARCGRLPEGKCCPQHKRQRMWRSFSKTEI